MICARCGKSSPSPISMCLFCAVADTREGKNSAFRTQGGEELDPGEPSKLCDAAVRELIAGHLREADAIAVTAIGLLCDRRRPIEILWVANRDREFALALTTWGHSLSRQARYEDSVRVLEIALPITLDLFVLQMIDADTLTRCANLLYEMLFQSGEAPLAEATIRLVVKALSLSQGPHGRALVLPLISLATLADGRGDAAEAKRIYSILLSPTMSLTAEERALASDGLAYLERNDGRKTGSQATA